MERHDGMRLMHIDEARKFFDRFDGMDGPDLQYLAPRETTICIEHGGLVAVFHPAPAWGVFFVHVARDSDGDDAAKSATAILEYVSEAFPVVETVIGLIDPENRAVRLFARRIGFKSATIIQTKRGPRMLVERI